MVRNLVLLAAGLSVPITVGVLTYVRTDRPPAIGPTASWAPERPLLSPDPIPDPMRTAEAAGLVAEHSRQDFSPSAVLVDRAGQVRHRFDRPVLDLTAAGEDVIVLTNRDVVCLTPAGDVRWAIPFGRGGLVVHGGLVPLSDGNLIAYQFNGSSDSGVWILRFDPRTGQKVWDTHCRDLGVSHFRYDHSAVAVARGRWVVVTSRGSGGTFVEALDVATGEPVERRVIWNLRD